MVEMATLVRNSYFAYDGVQNERCGTGTWFVNRVRPEPQANVNRGQPMSVLPQNAARRAMSQEAETLPIAYGAIRDDQGGSFVVQ